MSEVKIVDMPWRGTKSTWEPFILAALEMPGGKAVLVDHEGASTSLLNQAIAVRKMGDKLRARTVDRKVYIVHADRG